MTTSAKRDDGGKASERLSSKKQRLSYVSESDSSEEDSSSGEEDDVVVSQNVSNERVPLVLSDDSDSDEEKRLTDIRRSRRPKRLSPPKSMTLPNSDVLDCPCCFEPLKRPVFQCNNGHLACSSCCIKLKKKCSFCALSIGDIRCRSMEKVIKTCLVACSNSKYGCNKSTRYGKEVTYHEKLCVFAPCSCPIRNCNFVGSYKDLNNHFRATHKLSPGEIMSFKFNSPGLFGLHLDCKDDQVIFQEEKEGDLVVVQGFKGSHGVYVTVRRIAPTVKEILKLSYSIARLKDHSTLRLGFKVKNVQKVGEKQGQPEDNFMLIPSHMLSGYDLKMQISLGNEHVYTHI